MKKSFKSIFAALLLSSVFYANARTLPANPTIKTFPLGMYKVEGLPSVNVFVNKLEGTKMIIVLKDASGKIVHEEFMGKKETKRRTKFNLSALEKGTYSIELTDGKNVEIKNFSI